MPKIIGHMQEHDASASPIHLHNVTLRYDGVSVLEEINADIPAGEHIAVVGPNGAGKTTLMKLIAGLIEPTRGEVNIFGHGPSGHICIAYVPQRSQVDWDFPATVAEVVMMGRIHQIGFFHWPTRADWAIVREALESVDMQAYSTRRIGELSGGQQQRVFLAQALSQGAEVVLLDEPLSGLDIPSQEAILGILDDLRRDGVTVLTATHDLNLAAKRFDQVMLLNRRLISYGPAANALSQEALIQAYGNQIHMLPGADGALLLSDTCCDGEDEILES
ncbi:MAG TPA: metal ABC transporter ATP-binding protein [Anaerolineales bacterium]|nr:metal ABC transporter ATP-binding protein [Anaerolineales bacterium]